MDQPLPPPIPVPPTAPERDGTLRGPKIGALVAVIVFLLIGAGFAIYVGSQMVTVVSSLSSGSSQDDLPYSVGSVGTIARGRVVVAAKSKEQLNPMSSGELMPNMILLAGTQVKVLKVDPDAVQVQVLSGSFKGQQVWMHEEDLE